MKTTIVIGAGIGGLATALLLSQQGQKVLVLEQSAHPGGALQSFVREGVRFETGFHIVGGLQEGGPLYPYFSRLGLLDLPWQEVDGQDVWIGNTCYHIPTGKERWLQTMTSLFPHQATHLRHFLDTCQQIASCPHDQNSIWWEKNAWEWLTETIDDKQLRDVLSGSSALLELRRDSLPLFAFAEIAYSYICSIHRLQGGGQTLVQHLIQQIEQNGGEIRCGAQAVQIIEEGRKIKGVQLSDGTCQMADIIVSAIHPSKTMQLLREDSSIRQVYRQRISQLPNTMGFFTANIRLKQGERAVKSPVYIHRQGSDIWQTDNNTISHCLLYFYPEQSAVDILVPVSSTRFEPWNNRPHDEEYRHLKQRILDETLSLVKTICPDLPDQIEQVWTSSPLTWSTQLGAPEGTAFGIRKDCHSIETTILSSRTPLKGLYLTGQSLVLHGIMGTTVSAFMTAQEIAKMQITE